MEKNSIGNSYVESTIFQMLQPVMLLTNRVHESTVYISIQQVGHGQDGAVAEGGQTAGHSSFSPSYCLALILNLTAVI